MSWITKKVRGGIDENGVPYQTVWEIGRLRLHCFHRGDIDPDPHDHMWDFWTFPLVSYIERIWTSGLAPDEGEWHYQAVHAWRIHKRSAEHTHLLVCAVSHPRPIWTIVWRGPNRREWGFWVLREKQTSKMVGYDGRKFVPWRQYIYEREYEWQKNQTTAARD